MLELGVEHQAGIPVLMQPLRGNSRETKAFGPVVRDHLPPLRTTDTPPDLVAASALYRAGQLHKRAATSRTWLPRGPATWPEAQEVLAPAQPATLASLPDGSREAVVAARYGGVAQRGVLLSSDHRPPQAQRPVDTQWRTQSAQDVKAGTARCRTTLAGEAEAQPALTRCGAGLPTPCRHDRPLGPPPHSGKRGRPAPGAPPDQLVSPSAGALASRRTDRRARVDQPRGFLLATNARDAGQFSSQAVRDGYKGPAQAERGVRFRKAPQCLASSL